MTRLHGFDAVAAAEMLKRRLYIDGFQESASEARWQLGGNRRREDVYIDVTSDELARVKRDHPR